MSNTRNPYPELKGRLNVTGNNINKIRLEQNMSAQQLSDKLMIIGIDIHRQAIYDIEAGKRTVADYKLCAIAEILNTPIDTLLKDFSKYVRNEKV